MAKRILLGGLVGGIVVFMVSVLFHMATRLGEYGIKEMPHEDAALLALRVTVRESGLYLFPGAGMLSGKDQSPEAKAAYLQKYKTGPTGILVYRTGGVELQFGKLLVYQFLFGLVAAWLLAWLLGVRAGETTYGSRLLIVFLASLFAGIVYDLPYANWYGFPLDYTIAHIAIWTVSWVIAGFAMATIVKPQQAKAS